MRARPPWAAPAPPRHGGIRRPELRHGRAGQQTAVRGDLGQGQDHQSSCWQPDVPAACSHSDQCFCLPTTTSKTCEYIFCYLHLLVLHFCWHTYLLVSTGRPGT